jgi:hypothetical protein
MVKELDGNLSKLILFGARANNVGINERLEFLGAESRLEAEGGS